MSQHDYNIANAGGAAVRSDMNNALAAIQSLNSGATAPTATVAGMLWYDTATGMLKQRNSTNSAWVAAAELIAGGGQLAGMRNKIINGKVDIAQRGTSFAAAGNVYSVDRWLRYSTATEVVTLTQQADAPSNTDFQNSLRLAVTTADTSIAAGEVSNIQQMVEGFNARDLIGRTFTLSFWVRSSKTGTHCVAFSNSGTDRSYVMEYTVNAANTWEQKTLTVSGGLITAGTWNWATGIGLRVVFSLAAGSTFQTTANAWQTGNFVATANQVNCLDTIGNIFAITGVQLEVGSAATPFEHRPIGAELALCQRYFVKLGGQSAYDILAQSYAAAGSNLALTLTLPVTMRASPTTTKVGTWTATNSSQPVSVGNSTTNISINSTASASGATQFSTLDTTTYLTCSAEL